MRLGCAGDVFWVVDLSFDLSDVYSDLTVMCCGSYWAVLLFKNCSAVV